MTPKTEERIEEILRKLRKVLADATRTRETGQVMAEINISQGGIGPSKVGKWEGI